MFENLDQIVIFVTHVQVLYIRIGGVSALCSEEVQYFDAAMAVLLLTLTLTSLCTCFGRKED